MAEKPMVRNRKAKKKRIYNKIYLQRKSNNNSSYNSQKTSCIIFF